MIWKLYTIVTMIRKLYTIVTMIKKLYTIVTMIWKLYTIVTMIRKLYKHMLVTEWRPAVVIDYWLLPPSSLLTYRKQTKKSCNNYVQEVIRSERKNTLKENTSKVEWKSESDLFGRFPQISSPWRENCTYYEMWTHEDPGPGTQYLFGSRGRKFVRASKPCFSTKM